MELLDGLLLDRLLETDEVARTKLSTPTSLHAVLATQGEIAVLASCTLIRLKLASADANEVVSAAAAQVRATDSGTANYVKFQNVPARLEWEAHARCDHM